MGLTKVCTNQSGCITGVQLDVIGYLIGNNMIWDYPKMEDAPIDGQQMSSEIMINHGIGHGPEIIVRF